MDAEWCLSCHKQLANSAFTHDFASYCSVECMNREDLPLSPAPHAVNSRLRARFEGPSPIGWSRKVREPRSRSMSRARPRASTATRAPPVIQLGFDAQDRPASPESEVAWSLPAAGATRLVGSKWMGKDYEGIMCWAHGVRGYPDDDMSDDDSDSSIFDVKAAPIFPITLKTPRSLSRRPSSTQNSLTPRHMSVFTLDDTASLATPVTDNCLVQGYVESYQSSNSPPNQAAQRLRRFVTGSTVQASTPSAPKPAKERTSSTPLSVTLPKSHSEPVWITSQSLFRPDSQPGRDWGGLYDNECEKQELASDRIGSYIPTSSWQRGRTRQRSHTDHLIR